MIAYYVHDEKKENDVIVIPDRECRTTVDRERLEAYVRNQEEHHREKTFQDEFREFLVRYGIEYDERFVWD